MKQVTKSIALILLLTTCTGCLKEKDFKSLDKDVPQQVITATLEGGKGTRTMLSEPENGVYYPYWKESDELAVFAEGTNRAERYTLQSGAGTDKAEFLGPETGGELVGFYPYSGLADEGLSNHVLTLELPAVQHYVKGSFDDGAYPMLAVSRFSNLAFKNLCAVLRLSMTGSDSIESIRFISYDSQMPVSGKATVRTDFDTVPELTMKAGGSLEVTLRCDAVKLDPETPTDFFLVIPAGTYKGGFEVQIVAKEGRTTRKIHSDVTFERSQYRSVPLFDFDQVAMPLNYPEIVDLGLSVKWSSFNLGATAPEGYGDYYGWAETEPHYVSLDPLVWKEGKEGYGINSYKWYTWETDDQGTVIWAGWDAKYRTDGRMVLEPEDDAAYVNLGGNWRTPTKAELIELLDQCSSEYVTLNGINGYYLTGPNGNSIFIPLTGYWSGKNYRSAGIETLFMSANQVINSEGEFRAFYYSVSGCLRHCYYHGDSIGATVRPVYRDTETVFVKSVSLDQTDLELSVSESSTLVATVLPADASIKFVHWSSSDESVAIVTRKGVVTGISPGTAVITATTVEGEMTATCNITVTSDPYIYEVPDVIDMGLSVKWASFNLGAKKPEEEGFYYAWGETEPYYIFFLQDQEKGGYNVIWKDGKEEGYRPESYSADLVSKYCEDGKLVLAPEDDAAYVHLAGNWRMPTSAEMNELLDRCIWTWADVNGMGCWRVTGPSGNSIVLPAVGWIYAIFDFWYGTAKYWTSSLCPYLGESADYLDYPSGEVAHDVRYYGLPIRPVYAGAVVPVSNVALNKTKSGLYVSETTTLTATVFPENATNQGVTWSSSNESVATVTSTGLVTGVSSGTATITATVDGGKTAACSVTVRELSYAVPDAVDLGLSIKWASFNLGASKPEGYGDYFAWGETVPYYISLAPLTWSDGREAGYDCPSYKWCNGDDRSMTKYCTDPDYGYKGFTDGKTVLDLEDDAAHVRLGGKWRMPTKEEMQELLERCTWEETELNGVYGRRVTGPNGRSIFLPAAGRWGNTFLNSPGSEGSYWTSSLWLYPHIASSLLFWSENMRFLGDGRMYGNSIRPVFDDPVIHVESVVLDKTELSLTVGTTKTLVATVYPTNADDKSLSWDSSDKSVAKVDTYGMVIGLSPGKATITVTSQDGGKKAVCNLTVSKPASPSTGPEIIDLGLSVKWASTNLGASAPEEYGDYYAWGETEPYYSSLSPLTWKEGKEYGYNWPSYKWSGMAYSTLTKYCNDSTCGLDGFTDGKTVLDLADDAAHVKLGGKWRIPTHEEQVELQTKCSWEWTANGYKVTGPNGNSIFLPSTGIFSLKELAETGPNGIWGFYWSSSLYSDDAHKAHDFGFDRYGFNIDKRHDRFLGFSIRPVYGD